MMKQAIAGQVSSVQFLPGLIMMVSILVIGIAAWMVGVSLFRIIREMKKHQHRIETELAATQESA